MFRSECSRSKKKFPLYPKMSKSYGVSGLGGTDSGEYSYRRWNKGKRKGGVDPGKSSSGPESIIPDGDCEQGVCVME